MNAAQELLNAYRELHELTTHALESLNGGLDLDVLTPIFERKEVLNAQIESLGALGSDTAGELLLCVLEAQSKAARSEAALVQALQIYVSSTKTEFPFKGSSGTTETGKKWDLTG